MVNLFKACSDETRLRLLGILDHGDFNVNELVEIFQMGQSRISRHLKILADCSLVQSRREGNWIYYGLPQGNDAALHTDLRNLAVKVAASLPGYQTDLHHIESVIQRRRNISRHYFEKVGPKWEQLQRELLDSDYYREAALAMLPKQAQTVIDLGVGAGLLLPQLATSFNEIIAVDSSQRMLKIATEFAAHSSPEVLQKCNFRLGELDHLPVQDGTVDAAIALMVLHHVPKPVAAIAEIYRILKPGGTFVFADLHEHTYEEMRKKYADLWLGFSREELQKWMAQSGFQIESAEILKNGHTMEVLLFKTIKPMD